MNMKELKRTNHQLQVLMTRKNSAIASGKLAKAAGIHRSIESLKSQYLNTVKESPKS